MNGRYCQCHSFNITKHLAWAHSKREKDGAHCTKFKITEFNLELCAFLSVSFPRTKLMFECHVEPNATRVWSMCANVRRAKKKIGAHETHDDMSNYFVIDDILHYFV